MSRSYKKTYLYMCKFRSQKAWRSFYNRVFRHTENCKLRGDEEYSCHKNPYKHGYADVWLSPADGKAGYLDRKWVEEFFFKDDRYGRGKRKVSKRNGKYLFHK